MQLYFTTVVTCERFTPNVYLVYEKVQVGNDQERRNQKEGMQRMHILIMVAQLRSTGHVIRINVSDSCGELQVKHSQCDQKKCYKIAL